MALDNYDEVFRSMVAKGMNPTEARRRAEIQSGRRQTRDPNSYPKYVGPIEQRPAKRALGATTSLADVLTRPVTRPRPRGVTEGPGAKGKYE